MKHKRIQEDIRKMAPSDDELNEYLRRQKPKEEEREEQESSWMDGQSQHVNCW